MQITFTVVGTLYCLFIAMSDVEEVKGAKPSALPSDLKASIVSLMQDMKSDLVQHVKDCLGPAMEYSDEVYSQHSESLSDECSNSQLGDDLDKFLHADTPQSVQKEASTSGEFQTFASEFSVTEKTSAPVDDDLAKIVMGLINDKLPKMKLDELTEKYSRPENCEFLVAPKTNKAVWNQLRESTKKADNGMQKCQKMFMSLMYAILQACKVASGAVRDNLVHALVLCLSGNRELNIRRRELLRPDLNTQYGALCNASTPITTELFGDDVSKEIDEVSKANRLGKKLATPKRSRGLRFQPYGGYQGKGSSSTMTRGRYSDRSSTRSQPFLGERGVNRRRPGSRAASYTKTSRN